MYGKILLTLDGTSTDRAIIEHVKDLAKLAHSRLVLLHVADGWAARTYGSDAVSREISDDTAYLKKIQDEFQSAGIPAEAEHIRRVLARTATMDEAATVLGIDPSTLYRKRKRHGL